MSYYRLQARAPEPKTKKAAPRFAPPCVRNPLWQGLSAALAIMSLYQIHYSKFPENRGFDTPTCLLGLGGASKGVQTLFLHPLRRSGRIAGNIYRGQKIYNIHRNRWRYLGRGCRSTTPVLCGHSWLQYITDCNPTKWTRPLHPLDTTSPVTGQGDAPPYGDLGSPARRAGRTP